MHVATIIGTRPEIIKMSQVMVNLDKYYKHSIIHTGQNYDYELNQVFFDELGVRRPDYHLAVSGKNLGQTIANIISKSYDVLQEIKPDAVVVYGDTNSCLSVISAKRLKIPVFHLEAGNRSFDENVPEEINRRIVDHISDINFTLTEHARQYLLHEGLRGDRIIKTGGFMKEIIDENFNKINMSPILEKLNLKKQNYFVASLHREENVDGNKNLWNLVQSLNAVAQKYEKRIIFSCHPRTRKRLDELELSLSDAVTTHKPFGFFDYLTLQRNALCVISDSGTITEEADLLSFPAISPRLSHERPEGFDEGVIMLTNLNFENMIMAIDLQIEAYSRKQPTKKILDYNKAQPSLTVVKAIGSYVDYVNKHVWGTQS